MAVLSEKDSKKWARLSFHSYILFFFPYVPFFKPQELLEFKSDDIDKKLRDKIRLIGYGFTIDHNRVLICPAYPVAGSKSSF